jgi:protein-disulfide isomerase
MLIRFTLAPASLFVLASCASTAPPGPNAPVAGGGGVDPSEQAANLHTRMEAFRHLADPEAEAREAEELAVVWHVPVTGASPAQGSPSAPITIVEFGDFQCGFCVRAEKTLAQIRSTYGDAVRVIWRDDPLSFHERANAAAEFAREARAEKGDAGFWAAHDALLAARGELSDSALDALARRLGLDPTRVASAIAENRYQDGIDDDLDVADDVGAEGTPTFFINGRRLVGAEPFDSWKPILDAELAHGRALIAKGTSPSALYDTIVEGGRMAPDPRMVKVDVPALAPFRGDASAPVVVQEFADFQCPYCSRAEDALSRVLTRYPTRVKLVWRDLPLPMHAHAELAAEAAAEAKKQKGNVGFWAMHDKLLASQGLPRGLERDALVRYAKEIGLDVPSFEKALDTRAHAAEVTLDAKVAASAEIYGTPAFVVGGYVLDGAQPFVRFRKLIQRLAP